MQEGRKGENSIKGLMPGMPVLIVDDDSFLTDAFQILLEDAGFYVETAATGMQALSKAEAVSFKLVITNPKLPDIQGDELSSRLKELIPGVSVILLTGMNNIQNRDEKEPDNRLKKPIDSLKLLRVSNSLSSNM